MKGKKLKIYFYGESVQKIEEAILKRSTCTSLHKSIHLSSCKSIF